MHTVLRFLFRALLLAVGLVFAATLVVAFMVLIGVWSARSLWARLTGKPVRPFVMRMNPGQGFSHVFRAGQPRTARSQTLSDVTDVQIKESGKR